MVFQLGVLVGFGAVLDDRGVQERVCNTCYTPKPSFRGQAVIYHHGLAKRGIPATKVVFFLYVSIPFVAYLLLYFLLDSLIISSYLYIPFVEILWVMIMERREFDIGFDSRGPGCIIGGKAVFCSFPTRGQSVASLGTRWIQNSKSGRRLVELISHCSVTCDAMLSRHTSERTSIPT
ncbi:uncharacterized protein BDZ83DRAFT_12640 [Colletotrichum acutatum]|uniref:Uncharacterized protein n=1 Tax=Glomerella acutata TaxID=27357 RepID=A0AAD8XLJ6_GLOAC|nr:uncharacterized protein BDZ83DRAFT_12640 [Colletotrichum acutatum]KAK1729628.1 hypothetical protein BDZ83DRAFT_12640 [Colletotrichum acutatum]